MIKKHTIPKVFISYSWTSVPYTQKVLNLATRLRNDGVDVILDQWDLIPGQDMYTFMEQSINNADKVLVLCDHKYAEKAENRSGGVGTETQIISPEVYAKHSQTKFIPVVMEDNITLPTYLKSRFAIYFSDDYEEEYVKIYRTIFGRISKPPVGEPRNDYLDTNKHISNQLTKSIYPDLQINDRNIPFGRYPFGKNGEKDDILWRVINVDYKNNLALLITEYLIDCIKFDEKYNNNWETCNLRKWLNSIFIQSFNRNEIKMIADVSLPNQKQASFDGLEASTSTLDKVFILSIDEAKHYLHAKAARMAPTTPYAKIMGASTMNEYKLSTGELSGQWWLRTPSDMHGYIFTCVDYDGTFRDVRMHLGYDSFSGICVRPSLWLKM